MANTTSSPNFPKVDYNMSFDGVIQATRMSLFLQSFTHHIVSYNDLSEFATDLPILKEEATRVATKNADEKYLSYLKHSGNFDLWVPSLDKSLALRAAVIFGNAKQVEATLSDPMLTSSAFSQKNTDLLSIAAMKGYRDVVELLIKDPRVRPNGALLWAVRNDDIDIVRILMRSGRVDCAERDPHTGDTPLLRAVGDHKQGIEELLVSGGYSRSELPSTRLPSVTEPLNSKRDANPTGPIVMELQDWGMARVLSRFKNIKVDWTKRSAGPEDGSG
jgi:hypothetical protein